jgi:hypothetical protein
MIADGTRQPPRAGQPEGVFLSLTPRPQLTAQGRALRWRVTDLLALD